MFTKLLKIKEWLNICVRPVISGEITKLLYIYRNNTKTPLLEGLKNVKIDVVMALNNSDPHLGRKHAKSYIDIGKCNKTNLLGGLTQMC